VRTHEAKRIMDEAKRRISTREPVRQKALSKKRGPVNIPLPTEKWCKGEVERPNLSGQIQRADPSFA